MERPSESRAGDAFRRLMADAGANEHARVDALVACSMRTVWVATWEPTSPSFRTLEHDDGHTALPVFSDESELERAAEFLDWNQGNTPVPRREIPAREAMRQVLSDQLTYFVIDVAAEHCVEATRAEIEPLASADDSASAQGPFAAVGRITSTMIEAVRVSQAPTGIAILGSRESSNPPGALSLPRTTEPTPPPLPSLAFGSAPTMAAVPAVTSAFVEETRPAIAPASPSMPRTDEDIRIGAMGGDPPDAWLDAYAAALKQFPEVEWACFCLAGPEGAAPNPMIAVRVDPSFRQRVAEIGHAVATVSDELRLRIGTLLVDDPTVVRDARAEGVPFLPWRRRRSSTQTPAV